MCAVFVKRLSLTWPTKSLAVLTHATVESCRVHLGISLCPKWNHLPLCTILHQDSQQRSCVGMCCVWVWGGAIKGRERERGQNSNVARQVSVYEIKSTILVRLSVWEPHPMIMSPFLEWRCERERRKKENKRQGRGERTKEWSRVLVFFERVCVCVCVWERERDKYSG